MFYKSQHHFSATSAHRLHACLRCDVTRAKPENSNVIVLPIIRARKIAFKSVLIVVILIVYIKQRRKIKPVL